MPVKDHILRTNKKKVLYSNYIAGLIQYLVEQGLTLEQILDGCEELDAAQLAQTNNGIGAEDTGDHGQAIKLIDKSVGEYDLDRLLNNASGLLNKPVCQLGLEHGLNMTFTSHGPLWLASICSETAHDAMKTCSEFFYLLSPVITIDANAHADYTVVDIIGMDELSPSVNTFLISFGASSLFKTSHEIFGSQIFTIKDRFELKISPLTKFDAGFTDFFGAIFDIEEGSETTKILIPNSIAQLKLTTANPYTKDSVLAVCRSDMRSVEEDIVDRLKRNLIKEGVYLSLEEVAKVLCMSTRTLNRNLQQAGTSYSKILASVKMEHAKKLLANRRLSIKEIAFQLGYSETTNFSSAFNKYTGQRPKSYRATLFSESS